MFRLSISVSHLLTEITIKPFTNRGQTDPRVVVPPKFNRSNWGLIIPNWSNQERHNHNLSVAMMLSEWHTCTSPNGEIMTWPLRPIKASFPFYQSQNTWTHLCTRSRCKLEFLWFPLGLMKRPTERWSWACPIMFVYTTFISLKLEWLDVVRDNGLLFARRIPLLLIWNYRL